MSRQSINAGKAVIVVELTEKATLQFDKLISTLSSRMMAASRSLRNTALNATGGFLLTGMAVKSTMKDFMEFEAKMLNLAAKMGYMGTVTAEETAVMKDLSNVILSIGRSSAYTSQEVADAAISLAQAGFSAEELKGSLQGVIDLARGTNYALGESADFVANLVRTFDMFKGDDTLEQRTAKITSLTSQLVKSTRLGTIEIVDLREAFKYAGGTAKNLGVDVETMMGFFVQMSEAGLKASLAGTSINTMMLNLIRNVDLVKKKFPAFTIAMKDAGSIDLIATNRQLLALTANMDVASRTSFFQDIFNIRGARAFTAAMEIDRVEDFTDTIRNAGAESRLAAMKMESGAKGGLHRFTSALESLRIAIGKVYSDEITALLNGLAFLVTKFEEVITKHKYLIAGFLLTPGILAGVVAGSFALSFALARLATALKAVGVAGRGLRFLGGTMISSAQGMASLFAPKGPSRKAQIAAQTKAVAKMQAKVTSMTSAALKKKTPAGQAKALAAVASSKTMQNLVAAQQKLAALQKLPPNSLVGWLVRFGQAAKQVIPITQRLGKGIYATTKAIIDRQKAIKVNALMNSAIRGEQMIALRNERNFVAQMARVSTPIRAVTPKTAPLPGMSARRASQLKGINDTLLQIARNEGRLARFAAIQERTYDRLYKVRKQIAALEAAPIEQIVGARAGKRTPLTQQALRQQEIRRQARLAALRAREAKMANIVNRNVGPQQAFFAQQRQRLQNVFNAKQKVAAIEQARAQASLQRSLNAKAAAQTAASRTRQAATIARLDKAQVARRTASTMKIATLQSRLTNVKSIGSMISGGAAKGMSALMSGGKALAKTLFNTNTLTKILGGLKGLSLGFLKVAGSVGRFVFSWNFVGMIFNALLLFGDRIPVVVNAFSALGKGIGSAFGQIGKIFTYAAPAMQLFQLAFNAFLQGDTGTGITALQTGFQGIVSIIGNQLSAAWNAFMEHVEYLWVFLQKIYFSLETIFMSIFNGVSKTLGVVSGPIIRSFKEVFGMFSGGGGGFESMIYGFIVGLDKFITELFKAAIFLHEQLMKFLASFQDVMGQIIGQLPGMGGRGKAIQRDAATTASIAEMKSSMARGQLDAQQKKREKELLAIFNTNTGALAKGRAAKVAESNQASKSVMDWMSGQVELGQAQFMGRINARNAEMARLQQPTTTPQGETVAQAQQRIYMETTKALEQVNARLSMADKQKTTATAAEMKAMYDRLPDMATEAGMKAYREQMRTQSGSYIDSRERGVLEQQRAALQQQLYSMMTQNQEANKVATDMPKYLQALTGSAMSTRAIYRVDTKRQEDLLQQQVTNQEETNRLLRLNGGVQ